MATAYRASFGPDGIQLVRHGHQAGIRFPGARLRWQAEGARLASVNFLGAAPRSITGSTAIRAASAYPGIDIVLRMQDGRLKSEFQLAPGADPAKAVYCVDGAEVHAGPRGESLHFDAGEDWRWSEEGLLSWQSRPDGSHLPVPSRFALHGSCVGFQLDPIDPSLPLTIDPDLVFSSYLGGGLFDAITAIATDAQGFTYVGGWTESSDFPAISGYQTTAPGRIDGFVAKINAAGQLQFSTYLGGSSEDRVLALALSGAGVITVAGHTSSLNFPTASPAFATLSGGRDAFVARLSAAGNSLVFSTYLGGSGNDAALGLTIDAGGVVIAVGETASSNFPVQSAYSSANAGGVDGFLTRLSSSGSLLSSTYWGGAGDDRIRAVAASSDGYLHVTGSTASANLPIANAISSFLRGSMDAFYARFASVANAVTVSTYLGGSGGASLNEESGYGITIDTLGRAWIAGVTPSSDFPGVSGGYQSTYGGGISDAFVAVFSLAASLDWATYIGGTGLDAATAIAAGSGFVGLSGYTTSTNLPLSGALQTTRAGEYDAFWAAFPTTSATPLFISYLGGAGSDSGAAAAASGSSLTIAGTTLSANFPLASPVQFANAGSYGGFASRIRFGPGPITVSPSSGVALTQTFQFAVSHASGNASITSAEFLFNASYSFINGCYYSLDRTNNLIRLYQDAGNTWLSAAIGSGTILNNGFCSTPAASVTISTSASALLVSLPVTFSTSFAGAKNIYANATDSVSLGAGWPQVGTWSIVVPVAPTVGAVTPATGSGLSQSFSFTFTDTNGAADIATIYMLVNSGLSVSNGCYLVFSRGANTLSLYRDSDAAMLPLTPGAGATVENTRCSVTGTGVALTTAGNQVTLLVPITFKQNFYGARYLFASVTDSGNLSSGWQNAGSWTPAPAVTPSVISASPASGGAAAQTFTITVGDGNGASDIASAALLFNTTTSTANGCYIVFDRLANTLALFNDATSTFLPVTVSAATTVENSNCALTGAGATVTLSDTQLVLTLPITFKPSFIGLRTLYTAVADIGNLSSGWQIVGSWTPFANVAPSVVGVVPGSGSGQTQSFELTLTDGNAAADITTVALLFNGLLTITDGCYLVFDRRANTISLFNDADSTFLPLTPGAAATVQNANCYITGTGASVTLSANQLTLVLPITFKARFIGLRNIYAAATDRGSLSSGWQAAGTWTPAANFAPTVVSVSPASGTGPSQIFTVVVADANGAADLTAARFLLNAVPTTANACYITYSKSTNQFSLFRDSDGSVLSLAPGTAGSVENSNCQLLGAGLSVSSAGDQLTFTLPLSFKSAFTGYKSFYADASDAGGLTSGWQAPGGWNPDSNVAPTVTSVTPTSGSGLTQNFSFVLSDANGFSDISSAAFLFNNVISGINACYVFYSRPANLVYLFRDSDSTWISISPGSPGTVSNTNCTLSGASLSVSASGTAITLVLPVTFRSSFSGLKNTFATVTDQANLSSGWGTAGTWTVPGAQVAPNIDSLTPNSGSGSLGTFTIQISNQSGAADVTTVSFLIHSSITALGGCYVTYLRSANAVYLLRDSDQKWLSLPLGTAGSLQNANCGLSSIGLTLTSSGTTLSLSLPLTFATGFSGVKTLYVLANNTAGLSTGWASLGTWNTTSVPPTTPIIDGISPSSGSGPSRLFTLSLSDANGAADIATASLLVNDAVAAYGGCYLSYTRSTNTVYLLRDSDNVWLPLPVGSSGTIENARCSLSATGLAVVSSGNTLSFALPITFKSSFSGLKNLYALVTDSTNLSAGWSKIGSWNTVSLPPAAPTIGGLSPASGSGTSQAFTLTISDANGADDIATASLLLHSSISTFGGCYLTYVRSTNSVYLLRDTDQTWLPVVVGSSSVVENANCGLSGAGLTVTANGNTLSLVLPLTFKASFAGAKNLYVLVSDATGLSAGWTSLGTWTAP